MNSGMVLAGNVGGHHDDIGRVGDAGDMGDVADEIEFEIGVERGVEHVGQHRHLDGVAVRRAPARRLRCRCCWRRPAGSRSGTADQADPTAIVRSGARRCRGRCRPKANDHAHRPRWIGLRPGKARQDRQRDGARGQMQETAAGKFHDAPSTDFLRSGVSASCAIQARSVNTLRLFHRSEKGMFLLANVEGLSPPSPGTLSTPSPESPASGSICRCPEWRQRTRSSPPRSRPWCRPRRRP